MSPVKGGHASPGSPSSPNLPHAAEPTSGNSKDDSALDFLIDVLEPDINRGKAEKQALFSELSRIPTRRHGLLASARGPADGSKRVLDSAGNILLRHDHHTARSQDGPVTPRHGQAPFRLDHLEQRTPTHQGSRDKKPASPTSSRFRGATSPRNSLGQHFSCLTLRMAQRPLSRAGSRSISSRTFMLPLRQQSGSVSAAHGCSNCLGLGSVGVVLPLWPTEYFFPLIPFRPMLLPLSIPP